MGTGRFRVIAFLTIMNYIQKQATLHKIAQLKRAAVAVLLLKQAGVDGVSAFMANNVTPDMVPTILHGAKPYVETSLNSLAGSYAPGWGYLLGLGGGALAGGLTGALISDQKNKVRDSIIGALAGSLLGSNLGYGAERSAREYYLGKYYDKGVDDYVAPAYTGWWARQHMNDNDKVVKQE